MTGPCQALSGRVPLEDTRRLTPPCCPRDTKNGKPQSGRKRLRPAEDFLHFVQDKKTSGTGHRFSDSETGRFPLLGDPEPILQNGLISGGIVPRALEVGEGLPGQGRISRLAGPRQHLDKPSWLAEPFCDDSIDRAPVHGPPKLLNFVSKFTQYVE